MSKVIVEREDMVAIADSVRTKVGTTAQMNVGEIKIAIDNIETGVDLPTLSNEGTAANLLAGEQLINSTGNIVTGTMPNNGSMTKTMDGINTKSVSVPAGYTSGGTVSLTDDIDNEVDTQADLIAQISSVLDGKVGGGSSGSVEFGTFTLHNFNGIPGDESSRYQIPFIMGMTWDEWIATPMNMNLPSTNIGMSSFYISNNKVKHSSPSGVIADVSVDGTVSGVISTTDEIQNGVQYQLYINQGDFPT